MSLHVKILVFLLLPAALWGLLSCHPKLISFSVSGNSNCIYFGKGGGFTGQLFEYSICTNGKMYKKENGVLKFWGSVPENIKQQIFTNYNNLQIQTLNLNNPGNTYYFIGYQQQGSSIHKITWGNAPAPDKEISLFYNMMLETVKKFAVP